MSGDGPGGQTPAVTLYFATGNGAWDGLADFGDSIVKLGPPIAGSFNAPVLITSRRSIRRSQYCRRRSRFRRLLLLPNNASANAHLLVQAGKEEKSIC